VFFRVGYTYSKSLDDASQISDSATGGYGDAQNPRNLKLERGRSDWDMGHALTMNFTYETPRRWGRLLRGWQLAGTGRATTGRPFTPRVANVNLGQGEPSRPDRVAKGRLEQRSADRWFDTKAFTPVPLGSFHYGNSGRNILDAPGFSGINLAFSKRFRVRENDSLQFRAESFNFMNHTNFRLPAVNVDTATGGTITQAGAARTMQVGLRYQF
jgi:hypothetical protein